MCKKRHFAVGHTFGLGFFGFFIHHYGLSSLGRLASCMRQLGGYRTSRLSRRRRAPKSTLSTALPGLVGATLQQGPQQGHPQRLSQTLPRARESHEMDSPADQLFLCPVISALLRSHLCPRLGPRRRNVLPADSRPSFLRCANPLRCSPRSALKPTTPEARLSTGTSSLCSRTVPSVRSLLLLPPRHLSLHLCTFGARASPHRPVVVGRTIALWTGTSCSLRLSSTRWSSTPRRPRLAVLPHGASQVRTAAATLAPQHSSFRQDFLPVLSPGAPRCLRVG